MKRLTFLIILNMYFGGLVLAQEQSVALLNDRAIGLDDYSKSTFDKVYPSLQNSNIIGLGEATHGTQDFNVARIELIKYLIEFHGLRTIVFEAQFNFSQKINDYLIDNKGTAESAIKYLLNGYWHSQNMIDFLSWINQYNQRAALDDKVRYYGCDIYAPHWSLSYIEQYLKDNSQIDTTLAQNFDWFIRNRAYSHQFSGEEKNRLDQIRDQLNEVFQNKVSDGNKALPLVLQYKRLFEQYIAVLEVKGGYKASVRRDEFMAENVEFIYNYTNQKKMVIWAHNTHLARKSGHEKIKPLGSHLSAQYGAKYYALATAFNKGGFYARDYESNERKEIILEDAAEGSYDHFFSHCQYPNFFLNLENNEIPELDKRSGSRNIGAGHNDEKNRNYRKHVLTESYDGMLFFNVTQAVDYIPIEKE